MQSKKINQLATELAPDLTDITIIGDPTTGISKKITLSQMASLFTGTVEEYANFASFPLVGVADTIYIALDTNVIYRWNTGTSAYVELSPNIINSLVFGDGSGFDGTISLVGSVATLTITTALTTGSVGFIGASGALLEDNTNFFWNNTNKRLGIGTNTPGTKLDVHGTGTIVQINGTTTNNAFISFQNAGVSKWTIGNVQADHRFRIYSETNSAELVSVLQTGEFGIGIANPLTKFHIFGGASALIANLDANVSVAKSISYRSGNSSRINLEVSGTESGSNAGANFFIRRYSDAGTLIDTPLTITRSTGVITLANALPISSGGTGSITQNFVDLTTTQSIGGAKTFTSTLSVSNSRINLFGNSSDGKAIMILGDATYPTGSIIAPNSGGTLLVAGQSGTGMTIGTTGSAAFISAATFAGYVGINGATSANPLTVKVDTNLQFRVDQYLGTTNLASINGTASAYAGMKIDGTTIEINSQSGGGLNIGGATGLGKLDVGGQVNGVFSNICRIGNTSGINNGLIVSKDTSNNYLFDFGPSAIMRSIYTYNNTTATGANLVVSSGGTFERSTSSIRFKTNVEDLTIDTTNILSKMRPIWYRSLGQNDKKEWSWYGFIAEELAEIEPRLVQWGYDETSYETIKTENEQGIIEIETKLKKDAVLIPDGVQYERITVLLVAELQKMRKELDALKAK